MSELKGLEVAEKTFDLVLPVSKQTIKLRYAVRSDKTAARRASEVIKVGSDLSADDMFEFTYFTKVIVSPALTVDDIKKFAEKDIIAIRIADLKLNDMSKEEVEELVRDFAIALK